MAGEGTTTATRRTPLRAGEALTTDRFDISADVEEVNGRERRTGYTANYTMNVELTQLDRIGAVIDAALARGANLAGDISYSAANADSAQNAAIAIATAKARGKAAALASSLGGSLGSLIQATTTPSDDSPMYERDAARLAPVRATSITPTQLSIEATVLVRWHFVGR